MEDFHREKCKTATVNSTDFLQCRECIHLYSSIRISVLDIGSYVISSHAIFSTWPFAVCSYPSGT